MNRRTADDLLPRRYVTDEEWGEIRKSFERVGVDADTVMLPIGPFGHRQSLRGALPGIALACVQFLQIEKGAPTPKQLAENQSQTIKLCSDLRAWLSDPRNYAPYDFNVRRHLFRLDELAGSMRADLETLIAELERGRDMLAVMGASQGKGNRRAHNLFWGELTRVWR